MAGAITEAIGLFAAGRAYLHLVGPTYGFFGLGLALYFASQGAGWPFWTFVAGGVRLILAVAGEWIVVRWLGGVHVRKESAPAPSTLG